MTQRFLVLSAILLLLAACDQKQEQSQDASTPADGTVQTIQIPAGTGRGVAAPQDAGTRAESSNHTLACDNDFSKVEGFDAFLVRLRQAVTERDAAFIIGITDDHIKYSFGTENGKAGFITEWKLDSAPEQSPFWQEMDEVLRLGGYTQMLGDAEAAIIFPCTFKELPQDNWLYATSDALSAYDYVVVAQEDAELKDDRGETFRPLVFGEVLKRAVESEDRYLTHDGLEGTVDASALRSPLDYRAFFQRKDGEWNMPLFIAGD